MAKIAELLKNAKKMLYVDAGTVAYLCMVAILGVGIFFPRGILAMNASVPDCWEQVPVSEPVSTSDSETPDAETEQMDGEQTRGILFLCTLQTVHVSPEWTYRNTGMLVAFFIERPPQQV